MELKWDERGLLPAVVQAAEGGTVLTLLVSRANAGVEPLAFWRRLGLPAVVVVDRDTLELESVIEKADGDGPQVG